MIESDLEIRHGLPEELRAEAARILFESFREKLRLLGSERQVRDILASDFVGEHMLVALQAGRLFGVAGLLSDRGSFMPARPATFVRVLGPVRGRLAHAGWRAINPPAPAGRLVVDMLAVDAWTRSRGVGARLLQSAQTIAAETGYREVGLEVVDTNPRARQLYERMGFQAVATHHYPLMRPLMGFSAFTTMVRPVE